MSDRFSDTKGKRLDLAARAAWLYYIKGRTQDEIATALNVSRPNAQRLVALAISESLIKFRLDHPLLRSMELAERLQERFLLKTCEVAPTEEGQGNSLVGVAMLAAQTLEGFLAAKEPRVVALGTGRTLLETVRHMPLMTRPDHRIVSVVGNISRDGKASPYDVAMRLADRVGAQCYPLPLPVITDTTGGMRVLDRPARLSGGIRAVRGRRRRHGRGWAPSARARRCWWTASSMPTRSRPSCGTARWGELVSRSFASDGSAVENDVTARLTALRLSPQPSRPVILVAAGRDKVASIAAALRGGYGTGLLTDEETAAALLDATEDRAARVKRGALLSGALLT